MSWDRHNIPAYALGIQGIKISIKVIIKFIHKLSFNSYTVVTKNILKYIFYILYEYKLNIYYSFCTVLFIS